MKINREPLLKALLAILPLTGKRTTSPILNHFLVSAKDGRMSIRASDMECDAEETFEATGELKGCCVPAAKLVKLVQAGESEIDISAPKSGRVIVASRSKAELSTLDADEFPSWDKTGGTAIGLNTIDLARAIRSAAWAADPSGVETITSWVHVFSKDNKISAEASDKKSMARCEMPAIAAEFDILIPARLAETVCLALEREGAQLHVGQNRLFVKHDSGSFSCILGEGGYLPLAHHASTLSKAAGKISVKPLLEALNLAQTVADDPTFACVEILFGEPAKVSLKRSTSTFDATVEATGPEMSFWFDAKKLASALRHMDGTAELWVTENGHNMVGFRSGEALFAVSGLQKV